MHPLPPPLPSTILPSSEDAGFIEHPFPLALSCVLVVKKNSHCTQGTDSLEKGPRTESTTHKSVHLSGKEDIAPDSGQMLLQRMGGEGSAPGLGVWGPRKKSGEGCLGLEAGWGSHRCLWKWTFLAILSQDSVLLKQRSHHHHAWTVTKVASA